MRYDPFVNQTAWTFTTASSVASTTTNNINGILARVSAVEGTVSDADWAFAIRDQDGFVLHSNTSVTGSVTQPLYAVASRMAVAGPLTLNVSNANGAKTGTIRIYFTPF